MSTNQDILAFLKAEKETRAKEREEDMAKIAGMIREGVREEVKSVVEPLEERLGQQEKASQELSVQVTTLITQLKTLRDDVDIIRDFPTLPSVARSPVISSNTSRSNYISSGAVCTGTDQHDGVRGGAGHVRGDYHRASEQEQVLDICSKARRIVGFKPIEPRMLDIQMKSYGAKNIEEAMLMEVKSYLKCEMKVRPSQIEQLDIVRIFPPASKEDWNTLYVEFGSEYEVDMIFKHTRVMVKQDHNVVRWYPKELFNRFQALDSVAYTMREEMKENGVKLKTKVTVGRCDLEFRIKFPNGKWKAEPLPFGLPEIDLEARGLPSSPPPGRPRVEEDDRKRQHSGSEVVESSKKARSGDSRIDSNQMDSFREKQADQVGNGTQATNSQVHKQTNQLDPGHIVNEEAYCPSTPAKPKQLPDLPVIVNSPVFHSKQRTSQN